MKKFLQNLTVSFIQGSTTFKSLLILIVMFGFSQTVSAQAIGIFESYAITSTNGGANTFYDLGPQTTANPDFQGANFGTFGIGQSLVVKGGQNKTFKNSGGNVTGGNIQYRVWLTSAGASGAFTAVPMGFINDINGTGDQLWEGTGGTANVLTGLNAGNYTLEVYADAPGFPGTAFSSNGGANFKATFTVAPVTVTATTGTTFATYATVAAAVTAINAGTHTGTVVCSVSAGYTETAPAGGYSLTATGTLGNTITFIKSGSGANPTLTAAVLGTPFNINDAVFKIIGGDFITIDGFTLQERAFTPSGTDTAAATNTMTEFGIALLYATATNNCQNITLRNNTITLNRTYQNTFGIYANATHTATAVTVAASGTGTAGGNSNLLITSNTINNVNMGIVVVGPLAAADANLGLVIGGALAASGNLITNFGTTGTFSNYQNVAGSANGILVRNSNGFTLRYNTISSSVGGVTVGTLNGIQQAGSSALPTTTFTNIISNNTLSLQSGNSTGATVGITCPAASASTTSIAQINNNEFNAFSHTVATTGSITFILSTNPHKDLFISNNNFNNISVNTTGSVTFVNHSYTMPAAGTQTFDNNRIITGFSKTGAGGTITGFTSSTSSPNGSVHTLTNNIFSNITATGATAITGVNNTDGAGTSANRFVTGNTFNNWSTGAGVILGMSYTYIGATSNFTNTLTNFTGSAAITGLNIGNAFAGGNPLNITGNTINNFNSTGAGGAVVGINSSSASTVVNISGNTVHTLASTATTVTAVNTAGGITVNISKNKIYNVSGSGASTVVSGLAISAGTTITADNNYIGDLRSSAASLADAVRGLNITGGTNVNAFFNTIRLNATSSGTNFGTSAVSTAVATLNLRNNILVNASTANGTGLTVALRRAVVALATYANTSNNNLLYAGAASALNLLYTDGTNPEQTLAGFKARVASADANSITENAPFISTTGSDATFLHIDPLVQTGIEKGAVTIAGFTTDYDGDIRGSIPDIGADEGTFTPLAVPTITSLGATSGCQGTPLVVTGTNLSGITSATIGGTAATVTGTTATTATLLVGAGTTGTVTVTSGAGSATSSASFTVKPAPTTTWAASTPAVCFNAAAQTTTLAYTATTVSPINYSITWSPTPSNTFAAVTNQSFAGSAGGGSITINIPAGTGSGSYTGTIKTTNTDGCDSPTATFTVLVNSIPTGVTATASATTLCAGSDLSLTSTVDYVSVAVPGINFYTATRSTGTAYSSIIPATQVTSWRNAVPTNTDDNMSNNQPVGFNFTYNGTAYSTFRVSTNGFITFDNASAATGAGTAAYGYANDYTLAGSGLILAPNWDDLQTLGNLNTAADLNNSINYATTGSAGSRILTVEWKNMQDFSTSSTASYNWQVKLYEATGRIEFVYGTMTQSGASTASTGISGPTVSATPTAAQLLSQTNANTGTFGFTNQNTLSTVPATNTTIAFTPTYGTYSWTGPNAFTSALPNPTITAATAAASGVYNLSITNPTTGCSAPSVSTATVTVNPTSVAGTASASQTICSGTSPTALTLAGNTGTIQWQSSTDNVTFSNISGETTATLTIGTLTANAYYRAVVTSGVCASATSNAVTITVTPNTFNDTTLSACDTYTWANNGATYTTSGTYTGTTTGCVTQRLILTITPSSFNDTAITACTSYTWANNSVTYTMSGNYNGSVSGCVTERLVLTITPSVTPTFTQVAPICSGDILAALPTTSTNGVSGTWAPPLDNTTTTTYTFTPSGCASSTTMTIAVGGTKTWNAGWTPAGAPTSIDAVLITGNYTASTDGGTINGCSMTVDNGAVVLIDNNANIILQGKLTVTSGSVTVNNNSNLLQTRSIANSGNITIKRNSNALFRLDYTQWSTPVTGSGTLLQFSPATVSNRFYSYNSATNLYNAYPSPSTTTFDVARGYHIRMPNNWVASPLPAAKFTGIFTGVPNNGPQAITMSNTGATLGYNLVGNPYPSDMSMASFVAANSTAITGTLHFWRKSNNPAASSYSTWTSGTFNQGTATATDPNGVISVGQGFIVEAATGQTNLVFNNSMRVADNVDHFFRSATTTDYNRIWLNVTNATGGFSQSTVGYITGATNNSDSFDGLFFNDGDINLASLIGTDKYAIQGRQLPFDDNDVVPLSFKATAAGNYTFAIDHVDGLFSGSSDIYIRDNVAGTVNNLTTGAYNFAANAGTDNTRFELLYRNALSTNNSILSDNNVFVFKANNAININTGKIEMDNVKVFDIRGRLLVEKSKVNASTLAIDSSSFANQVLIVTITSTDGVKVSKKIVN